MISLGDFNLAGFLPFWFLLSAILTVIFTEVFKAIIKKVDVKNRLSGLKGFKVWMPLLLSVFFTYLLFKGSFFKPEESWFWCAALFGVSVFFYEAILKKIKRLIDDEDTKKNS